MRRGILKGAFIGGIVGPSILACVHSLSLSGEGTLGSAFSSLFGYLVFHLFVCSLGGGLLGGVVGFLITQQVHRCITKTHLIIYCTVLGVCLGAGTLYLGLAFFYSFGAIANSLSLLEWLSSFSPLFLPLLPLAVIIGIVCSTLTTLWIHRQGR